MYDNSEVVDSRQYRFGYKLQASSDVPEDFPVPIPVSEWRGAIFMPGETQECWRASQYPPRIYILTTHALAVYSHPASTEAPFTIPLDKLIEVGAESALLYGALEFHGADASRRFCYNAAHQRCIALFLRDVRSLWLPIYFSGTPLVSLPRPSEQAEFRCWYAMQAELDPEEHIYGSGLQPEREQEKRSWLPSKRNIMPAVLLTVTNHRMITISSSKGATRDYYGVAMRYTSPASVSAVSVEKRVDGFELCIKLKSDQTWTLSFANESIASITPILALLKQLSGLHGFAMRWK